MVCLVICGVTAMTEAVYFMRQINDFIANNPDHQFVVLYNNGEIGLGYIIRHWKEISHENCTD